MDDNVHPQLSPTMRPSSKRLITFACVTLLAPVLAGGCANPRTEANIVAAMNDAANEISGLKSDLSSLQGELDSLRTVVAKQDTTIGHLAAVANVPITK